MHLKRWHLFFLIMLNYIRIINNNEQQEKESRKKYRWKLQENEMRVERIKCSFISLRYPLCTDFNQYHR